MKDNKMKFGINYIDTQSPLHKLNGITKFLLFIAWVTVVLTTFDLRIIALLIVLGTWLRMNVAMTVTAFFGLVGDRLGRSRTLVLTILTYALFTGLSFFAQTWWQLMICRFLAALGIGGEWAVGASLLSETWPARWRWASIPAGWKRWPRSGRISLAPWRI